MSKNNKSNLINEIKETDDIQKMKHLINFGTNLSENTKTLVRSNLETYKEGADGKIYGIVKENSKYYIKIANKGNDIVAENFNYIGGEKNKMDYVYESYNVASKQLDLKMMSLNEAYGVNNNKPLMVSGNDTHQIMTEETKIMKETLDRFKSIMHNSNNINSYMHESYTPNHPGTPEAPGSASKSEDEGEPYGEKPKYVDSNIVNSQKDNIKEDIDTPEFGNEDVDVEDVDVEDVDVEDVDVEDVDDVDDVSIEDLEAEDVDDVSIEDLEAEEQDEKLDSIVDKLDDIIAKLENGDDVPEEVVENVLKNIKIPKRRVNEDLEDIDFSGIDLDADKSDYYSDMPDEDDYYEKTNSELRANDGKIYSFGDLVSVDSDPSIPIGLQVVDFQGKKLILMDPDGSDDEYVVTPGEDSVRIIKYKNKRNKKLNNETRRRIGRKLAETTLHDFGKHVGYRKKPIDIEELEVDNTPFGSKVGDGQPFNKNIDKLIVDAVVTEMKRRKLPISKAKEITEGVIKGLVEIGVLTPKKKINENFYDEESGDTFGEWEREYEESRDQHLSKGRLWGFELKNEEGDYEYNDVTYDKNSKQLCWGDICVDVDPDFDIDANLESLVDTISLDFNYVFESRKLRKKRLQEDVNDILTPEELEELKTEINDTLSDGGTYSDVEDIMMDYGLEMDYLFDVIGV